MFVQPFAKHTNIPLPVSGDVTITGLGLNTHFGNSSTRCHQRRVQMRAAM